MLCTSGVGRRDAAVHGLSCCREQSELAGCAPNPPRLLPARGSFLPAKPGNSTAGCCCWAGSCAVLCACGKGTRSIPVCSWVSLLPGCPILLHVPSLPSPVVSGGNLVPAGAGRGAWEWGTPLPVHPWGGFQTYSAVALQLRVELRASYSDVCGRGIGCCINHSSGQPAFGAQPCF